MQTEEVLRLLACAGEQSVSGEAMSETLGVSRAAVWKAVEALRQEGYVIASATNRGYRLQEIPDRLSSGVLRGLLDGRVIGREIACLTTVDSTNDEVKRRAAAGAEEGLIVLAETQSKGKGRRGRLFESPAGTGLYLSVLLRPQCRLDEVFQLTAWSAVAVCRAVEQCTGLRPAIKWTNDIVLGGRKLCGILTELGIEGESGRPDYVALGIGINLGQQEADFAPEVRPVAISLAQAMGKPPRRMELARALLTELDEMYAVFPAQRAAYLEEYRARCITLHRPVRILRLDGSETPAFAEDLGDDFSLHVRTEDGERKVIQAGEVSVRGLYGYADESTIPT